MEEKDLYMAEYSVKQKSFHIESLRERLIKNTINILEKKSMDFMPFFIGTQEDCHKQCDILRELQSNEHK
jgi:hypothetical protein